MASDVTCVTRFTCRLPDVISRTGNSHYAWLHNRIELAGAVLGFPDLSKFAYRGGGHKQVGSNIRNIVPPFLLPQNSRDCVVEQID